MPNLHRKGEGQPIREAMKAAGLSGPALAAATKKVDATGRGISSAAVGQIAGTGKTAHLNVRLRTAWLIATALNAPLQALFAMPGVSTSTAERSNSADEDAS